MKRQPRSATTLKKWRGEESPSVLRRRGCQLDYSATTPTHPQVIERVATILQHHWGNPSSLHTWGQDTATVIEMAREQVAGLINANSDQIIFTSGGTAIKLKLISPPGKPPKAGSNVKEKK